VIRKQATFLKLMAVLRRIRKIPAIRFSRTHKPMFPYCCQCRLSVRLFNAVVEASWNVMAHGDARKGKWRGNWRMEWVATILHTTSSITTTDAHTSAASIRLNWRPRRFKWTRPFRRKTKSGFCACAIVFQLASSTFKNWGLSPL